MSFAIQAVELSKNYGEILALKDLSFEIPQGEVVAFLGPNSAGKTTTLKILAGIMPASFGEATVAGFSAAYEAREVKRHVGYMPEHNPLPDDATVEEFLTYRGRLKEIHTKKLKGRILEVAAMTDLSNKILRRPIGVLSRGVRQRVGIADALLTAPPILLLDEPTIGLDPHQVLALRDLICGMRGKHTILLSTHILTEAEAMADRILIINKGRKVAFGTAAQLKGDYAPINEIVLSVNLIPEKLLEVLKPLGCSWREPISRDGAFYRYTIASASLETSQKLLQTLSKTEGVVVNEFVRPVPTLESIFVKATLQREDLN